MSATTEGETRMSLDGTNPFVAADRGRGRRAWRIGASILAVGAIAGGLALLLRQKDEGPRFVTAPVSRGDVIETIEATGTVEPVVKVTVGAQVSGRIATVHADFNDVVAKAALLATLEAAPFEAEVAQSQAALSSALAQLQRARVEMETRRKDLERARQLVAGGLTARADLDAAEGAFEMSAAQVKVAEAQTEQARASVQRARQNLGFTKITAPIDGTVISRTVEPGQTVAASLQAPELFVIANDLTTMRVMASIDEADVGKVVDGATAAVRVEAFPNDVFEGTVEEVRVQPTTTSGVVTYPAVVDVPNPERKLRPGMTATVTLTTASRPDVLRVPNAALRYTPTDRSGRASAGRRATGEGRPEGRERRGGPHGSPRVYIPGGPGEPPRAIAVQTGASDGTFTEVSSDGLSEGLPVILDEEGGPEPLPIPAGGGSRRGPRLF